MRFVMDEDFAFKKEVDWSLLHVGITLPTTIHPFFTTSINRVLSRGQSIPITLLFAGKEYSANLLNVGYSSAHKTSSDTLQIRYSEKSNIAQALRTEFCLSDQLIEEVRSKSKPTARRSRQLTLETKEYLAVYATDIDSTYIFEAISVDDTKTLANITQKWSEQFIERFFEQDYDADVIEQSVSQKIRKLNKKIGDNLKLVYDFRCQICGHSVGDKYGTHVVEAHHIDYFISSHNNDAQNIIIVCPNHHSIIHANNPVFKGSTVTFCYNNGYKEKLLLNHHISVRQIKPANLYGIDI